MGRVEAAASARRPATLWVEARRFRGETLNLKLATTDRSLRATWSRERTARLAPGQELRAIANKAPAAMQLPQGPPFSWDRACRHKICEAIF